MREREPDARVGAPAIFTADAERSEGLGDDATQPQRLEQPHGRRGRRGRILGTPERFERAPREDRGDGHLVVRREQRARVVRPR